MKIILKPTRESDIKKPMLMGHLFGYQEPKGQHRKKQQQTGCIFFCYLFRYEHITAVVKGRSRDLGMIIGLAWKG